MPPVYYNVVFCYATYIIYPRLFARSLLRAMSTSEFKQAPHKYVPSTICPLPSSTHFTDY